MLTKEKRNKLIGGLLTLTMGTTLVAGCASEDDNKEEWQNDNAAVQQQSSDNSFWGMVTAFGLGYALSHLFSGPSTPQAPPKQPPAYTSTAKPGEMLRPRPVRPAEKISIARRIKLIPQRPKWQRLQAARPELAPVPFVHTRFLK